MKYSIIIPYRDREAHLSILLPRLIEFFDDVAKDDYEIIVSEQADNENFRIACVENIGYLHSQGDIVVFHQVDYYPTKDVSYEVNDYPVLPAKRGIFLTEDMSELRPMEDIPAGYRKWSEEIDPRFYGGIIAMKREHFEKINGFNPMYKGWGNEDEDVRERFTWVGLPVIRNEVGTFYVLHHKDNCPTPQDDPKRYRDFTVGREIYRMAFQYRHIGYNDVIASTEKYKMEGYDNVLWLKSWDYKVKGIDV